MNSFENYPKWLLEKWQEIADLLAGGLGVSAALIMNIQNELIEVFVSSQSKGNPYSVGGIEEWYGLYCETVIKTQSSLFVKNALKDKKWENNPDAKLGMIAYLGYPINFPNKKPFGTICILDDKERNFTTLDKALLQHFKNVIELDLALMQSYNLKITELDATILQEYTAGILLEKKLQSSQLFLKSSLESSNDVIVLALDKDYNYLYFNQAHKNAMKLAYGKDVDLGMNLLEQISTNSERIAIKERYYLALNGTSHSTIEKWGDITANYYETFYNTIRDENGEIIGCTAFAMDITDRVNAKKELEEERAWYKLLLENSAVGYSYHKIILDRNNCPCDYEFVEVNTAFEKATGLLGADIIGRRITEILPGITEGRFDWIGYYGDIALNGGEKEFEQFAEPLNKWYRVNVYSPEKYYFITNFIDISNEKAQFKELENSKNILSNVLEGTNVGTWVWNVETGELTINERWADIIGYSLDEVSPVSFAHWLDYLYADDRRRIDRELKNVFERKTDFYDIECRMKHKDGNLVWIQTRGKVTSWAADGKPLMMSGTHTDITYRKNIEQTLEESERTYKALFDYSGVGIAYYTKDGHVISYNEKAATNMGGSRADFEGKSIFDLFPKENAELYLDRFTVCVSSDEPQHYEDFVSLPTGDLWFYSTYTRILDANGFVKGVQVISHDISELKEKEKEISYLSYHDQLTGLYNRRFFDEELIRLDTSRNLPLTIAMGDVNGLKLVNDSFGHKTGDQLLICVADVLKKACRQDDIIARVGGDEFSIIFPKTDEKDADMIIQRINRLISQEKIGPLEFSIAFSYGTKTADESIDSIIKKAEDHMYRNKLNDSSSLRNSTIRLIMNTLFEKNNRELKHSERVSSLCVDIAMALGFEKNEINHIRSAGLMHDIGKIGIDEHVLNSETKLTDDEWKEVKKHSEIGYRILSSAPDFSDIAEDVFSHHERWDGKGYPRGINGESISIYARIITIADAFDAMMSERPYRTGHKTLKTEDAINEIKKNAGSQFDPVIAKLFVEKVLHVEW